MSTTLPTGPAVLGLELGADASVSDDGWLLRELWAGPGLDGPPGVLQGGFAAAVSLPIARAVDRYDAPLTALHARLHAPTPLERHLEASVRAGDTVAGYDVELRDGDTTLVTAEVELAGTEPGLHAHDLLELATVPLPEPRPQQVFPTCWACGPRPRHPFGQRLHPRYHGDDVVVPWVAAEELGDERGVVDPLVVAAVLDCPSAWAGLAHARSNGHAAIVLADYHLQVFRDAPIMEPLRTVARLDSADGRKLRSRCALVDEDGVLYALASTLQISAPEIPRVPPPAAP